MHEYTGILTARVFNPEPLPSQLVLGRIIQDGDWRWNQETTAYRNPKTRKTVRQRSQVTLRNTFVDRITELIRPLDAKLFEGEITIQQWLVEMRKIIRLEHIALFLLGVGGVNNFRFEDYVELTAVIIEEYEFLQAFASQMQREMLSEAQIDVRAEYYIGSGVQSFERGKAYGFDVALPTYPANGNQICLANCRCYWLIFRTSRRSRQAEQFKAYWNLRPQPEDCCITCLTHRNTYGPLLVERR